MTETAEFMRMEIEAVKTDGSTVSIVTNVIGEPTKCLNEIWKNLIN